MRRPWQTWTFFLLSLAITLAAMGWISRIALAKDRSERTAEIEANREEKVRLALWRMETALAGILAQENLEPYFAYQAFYSTDRAYTRMFSELGPGEVLLPSRLLVSRSLHVQLHFQIDPQDTITSPEVPLGSLRSLALKSHLTEDQLASSAERLAQLKSRVDLRLLCNQALPRSPEEERPILTNPFPEEPSTAQSAINQTAINQTAMNQAEYQSRARSQKANIQNMWAQNIVENQLLSPDVGVGPFAARWLNEDLILAREVLVNGTRYVQGCWLDWSGLQKSLVAEVEDLLPEARLLPADNIPLPGETRRLAALPVKLIPGNLLQPPPTGLSPLVLSLLIAWACVLLAGSAAALLLSSAISLSERRGAFVSAVTHELRTPLTTLRLYTEMLAENRVSGEEKRTNYLNTLRREADRLNHLVENVLVYSRLENRKSKARREAVQAGPLTETLRERLQGHAEQQGMGLKIDLGESSREARVRVDPAAVEQILFNLVDNACKYAAQADDPTIHLEVNESGGRVVFKVRDHGPGILPQEARRLFQAFCKSAHEAAHSAPGVGLGLALSRRLAREMGGDLVLDSAQTGGAAFMLLLPKI